MLWPWEFKPAFYGLRVFVVRKQCGWLGRTGQSGQTGRAANATQDGGGYWGFAQRCIKKRSISSLASGPLVSV
jgi:hypothetical protein